jgi:SAM-dependent MidA family methyltransferase
LGIDARTAALARTAPDRADALLADRRRLMEDMGELFRALALTAPSWPAPAAFA